ncbi:hypothetical protein M3M35_07280 [Fructilactobacillus myrtifloralis]|uniref:Uncharacterized protein n=1 Tax=Fructilactobacillus myrtifloralis TaxID=2940301 RepID=A0ABY5BNL9_9LACO|nr:hypothetical protein [Fructilactobacillus myrtifloralis]USS85084.1 hypothetical protein M3M35_07280 [Fructilactobacillus myrtifloralis]
MKQSVDLQKEIADTNYFFKQMFENFGVVPSQIANEDFDELMETLAAQPKEKRTFRTYGYSVEDKTDDVSAGINF